MNQPVEKCLSDVQSCHEFQIESEKYFLSVIQLAKEIRKRVWWKYSEFYHLLCSFVMDDEKFAKNFASNYENSMLCVY